MREIKFRARVKGRWIGLVEGQWEYFGLDDFIDTHLEGDSIDCKTLNHLDLETVGQYTGLKDKNVKEIYEGDIISMSFNRYPQNWQVGELTEYGLTFQRITNKPFSTPYQYRELRHFDEAEIIGNIYENPELLEVRK